MSELKSLCECGRVETHLSFRHPKGGSDGYIVSLSAVPRLGEEILLLDGQGEELYRQNVTNVRHIVVVAHQAAHSVEVRCG